MQTYAEQRAAYEATRGVNAAAMKKLMDDAAAKGETLDAEGQTQFDDFAKDNEAIDGHIARLKKLEALNIEGAQPVKGLSEEDGSASRRGLAPVTVKAAPGKVMPGMGFTRYVKALAMAKGDCAQAFAIAQGNDRWVKETPDVISVLDPAVQHLIKAAVAAGTTTDTTNAAPLVQYANLASEFIEFLRPMTIVGKLNTRAVPFKIKIPRQTGGASVNWVGESKV
ncbi:MAG: hypothetical protein KIS90_00750, partial [Phenylobacterium sp.]|nr:hypothetical protein [Phenylobacterium sp.]